MESSCVLCLFFVVLAVVLVWGKEQDIKCMPAQTKKHMSGRHREQFSWNAGRR